VQYLYVADELTRTALFRSGGGEVLDIAGNGRIANELEKEGYQIITQQGGVTVLVPDSLNADSPWSNLKVRQAAEYAIDKEAIVKTFGYGYSEAAYQLPSSSSSAFDPGLTDAHKYDVAKAKQLLVEAGYPNGFKTKIIAQNTVNRDNLVAIQSYLSKVGIQCELEITEPAKMQQYQNGTWKNAILYTSLLEYPNYNASLNLYFSPSSAWFQSMKKPDGWKEALNAPITTIKPDPELMKKCIKMTYDDQTIIALSYGVTLWGATTNVHDTGIGTRGSTTHGALRQPG
jgi:peptide/nickel transport system substrate-binding protein